MNKTMNQEAPKIERSTSFSRNIRAISNITLKIYSNTPNTLRIIIQKLNLRSIKAISGKFSKFDSSLKKIISIVTAFLLKPSLSYRVVVSLYASKRSQPKRAIFLAIRRHHHLDTLRFFSCLAIGFLLFVPLLIYKSGIIKARLAADL